MGWRSAWNGAGTWDGAPGLAAAAGEGGGEAPAAAEGRAAGLGRWVVLVLLAGVGNDRASSVTLHSCVAQQPIGDNTQITINHFIIHHFNIIN